jgi:hypothetical protein
MMTRAVVILFASCVCAWAAGSATGMAVVAPASDTAVVQSPVATSAAAAPLAAQPDARRSASTEVERMRDEARVLRREADDLRQAARRLENEGDRLERRAADRSGAGADGGAALDTSAGRSGPSALVMESQMRSSADSLLQKARDINARVRTLEEDADRREGQTARAAADTQVSDKRPLTTRFPLSFGYQNHYTAVPPYDDGEAYVLRMSGLYFAYSFTHWLHAGVRDIMLYFVQTTEGTRYALSLSPYVGASWFALRRMECVVDVGVGLQGQAGPGPGGNDAVIVPFASLGDELWLAKHFSLGPMLRVNYVAVGNLYAGALPRDKSDVLPQGSAWFDAGLSFSFHF